MAEFEEELRLVFSVWNRTKDGANIVVVVMWSDWEARESNLSHFSPLTSLVTRIFWKGIYGASYTLHVS